jgi:hypothetical protein
VTTNNACWPETECLHNKSGRLTCTVPRIVFPMIIENSPLGRVGLRFKSQLCFFLPTTRHQEIQGVGYAHHTCGRRPWVWTPLTVLVRLPYQFVTWFMTCC